MAEQD